MVIKITASCFVLALAVILFVPIGASAQNADDVNQNLAQVAAETPLQNAGLITIVGNIIKILFGILGVIALVIVLYAGFLYMTSGGDQEKVMTAKKWLINGVIGLAIIFSAYSITMFLFGLFTDKGVQLAGGPKYQTAGLTGGAYGISGGAFGHIIQNHFPKPEQTGVPRNTMILVTFKTPIFPDSVIDTTQKGACPNSLDPKVLCGPIRTTAIRVFRCADMIAEAFDKPEGKTCANVPFFDIAEGNACKADADCKGGSCSNNVCVGNKLVSGYGIITEDHKTIIFNPYGDVNIHLGDANKDVPYVVFLTSAIKKDSDPKQTVFSKAYPDYKWRFTTSIFLDLTPPQVSSVVPAKVGYPYPLKDEDKGNCKCKKGEEIGCAKSDCDGNVYLNQAIYVNFNEPVIPPLTQTQNCNDGDSDNEAQLTAVKILDNKVTDEKAVESCQTKHVPGGWKVGINQYKTVQFVAKTKCAGGAINSCGEPAFCLPEKAALTGKVLAAKLLTGTTGLPGTGIMDLAGNSLDGNANGKTEGPGKLDVAQDDAAALDNFLWTFATGNVLDLTGPAVITLEPNNATGDLGNLETIIKAFFTEDLDADSVDTEAELIGKESDGKDFKSWFDSNLGSIVVTKMVDDKPVDMGEAVDMTQVAITHGPFSKYNEGDKFLPFYTPIMKSSIKDSRQNCFSPMKEDPVAKKPLKVDQSSCDKNNQAGKSCCPGEGFDFSLNSMAVTECASRKPLLNIDE